MLTLCWAAKGGSGTTVIAAGLALAHSPSAARTAAPPHPLAGHRTGPLLVDLGGGLALVLGVPEPPGPGIVEWLATDAGPERLHHLEADAGPTMRMLPRGHGPITPVPRARWDSLVGALTGPGAAGRDVVVDAGTGTPHPALLEAADRRLLVTRNCYLAIRAAVAAGVEPTGVVLVEEPGRRLGVSDVEAALGAPVVAVILTDPAIARAVDAGLMLSRMPATLRRGLRHLAHAADSDAPHRLAGLTGLR